MTGALELDANDIMSPIIRIITEHVTFKDQTVKTCTIESLRQLENDLIEANYIPSTEMEDCNDAIRDAYDHYLGADIDVEAEEDDEEDDPIEEDIIDEEPEEDDSEDIDDDPVEDEDDELFEEIDEEEDDEDDIDFDDDELDEDEDDD